jgi:PAS domain S-box-containing protein
MARCGASFHMRQIKMSQDRHTQPRWLTLGSLFFLLLAVVLFVLSVRLDAKSARFTSLLVPVLLVAVLTSTAFHLFYWRAARRRRIADDAMVYSRERELSSIFEHALDGILILDDACVCVDANPAACALLGVGSSELVSRHFGDFYCDREEFAQHWKSFLSSRYQRGQMRLVGRERNSIFVDYTATANYVPGRHVLILCDTTRQKRAETSLQTIEERFRQMADHIHEVFWMMDAQTKKLIYVNRAFETVTGWPRSVLDDNPLSYREIIHPEDRLRVLAHLDDSVSAGEFNEEFRITRADGSVRWIWARAFPVRNSEHPTGWLIGTALDVTTRKQAEIQISSHLAAAEAARAEAEALRRSTLALTQNLAMDSILDTLLACLADVVPYTSACVLFAETDFQLLVAREAPRRTARGSFTILNPSEYPILNKILRERKSVFLADAKDDSCLGKSKIFSDAGCWMGIPLIASDQILGILSIAGSDAHSFTPEHLRMAKSLAIPAAVGIQNARTHERAEIYAAELEVQLRNLQQMQKALEETRSGTAPH